MDNKAKSILNHYKKKIENKEFDEYDIMGFLIFVRSYIHNRRTKYKYIIEFMDLIAHREREKGEISNSMFNAITNNYNTINNEVIGYNGIKYSDWIDEWNSLANEFDIKIDEQIINEITICIFSLAQKSIYSYIDNPKNRITLGIVELVESIDNCLGLCTTEGNGNSKFLVFAKSKPCKILNEYPAGLIDEIVETQRTNNKLYLISNSKIILEV